jgi:hypothetical protein
LLDAEQGYYGRSEELVRVLEEHLGISRELTAIIEARTKGEPDSGAHLAYARFCQSSIELALIKARRGTDD